MQWNYYFFPVSVTLDLLIYFPALYWIFFSKELLDLVHEDAQLNLNVG